MSSFFNEFKKFILRGNVIDMAIAVVIGAAFGKVVDSIVADLFMPIIGVVTGGLNLEGMSLHLYGDARLMWGKVLQTVINFVIIGFCMFLVVKGMNSLHQRFIREEAAKTPPPTETEKLLAEIRDLLKDKHPTSPPVATGGPS